MLPSPLLWIDCFVPEQCLQALRIAKKRDDELPAFDALNQCRKSALFEEGGVLIPLLFGWTVFLGSGIHSFDGVDMDFPRQPCEVVLNYGGFCEITRLVLIEEELQVAAQRNVPQIGLCIQVIHQAVRHQREVDQLTGVIATILAAAMDEVGLHQFAVHTVLGMQRREFAGFQPIPTEL